MVPQPTTPTDRTPAALLRRTGGDRRFPCENPRRCRPLPLAYPAAEVATRGRRTLPVSRIAVLVLFLLTGLAASLLPAQEARRTLAVDLETNSGSAPASAPLVRVNSQGRAQPVVDVRKVEPGDVGVHIYFDLPLTSPAAASTAAELLTERATALARLGVDRVAVAQASVANAPSGTETGPAIASALQSIAARAREAGELWLARRQLERDLDELEEASGALGEKRRRIVAHYQEELALLEWQQALLEDWLFGDRPAEPSSRVLLLIRANRALDPAAYARRLIEQHEVPLDELTRQRLENSLAERQREFARTAAALGWAVHLLDLETAADTEETSAEVDLASGMVPPRLELPQATAGDLITSAPQLDDTLSALERRFLVTFLLEPEDQSAPPQQSDSTSHVDPALVPLDLSVGSGLRVRGPRWTHLEPPRTLARVRARRLLQDGESGSLPVVASLVGEFAGAATLETVLALDQSEAAALAGETSDRLRVTVVTTRLDRDPELRQLYGGGARLDRGAWALQSPVELPEDRTAIVVVAEDLMTGQWGAALAEPSDIGVIASLSSAEATVERAGEEIAMADAGSSGGALTSPGGGERAPVFGPLPSARRTRDDASPSSTGPSAGVRGKMLEILPPRGRPLLGKQTFKILLTNPAVRRVVFELDGEQIHDDDDRPFQASVDLGDSAAERRLRAIAYSATGALLGEDVLRINRSRQRQGIELTEVDLAAASGDARVLAELRTPSGQTLDRVELYRNERLIATLTRPPFQATLPGPSRPDADFVRAVAWMRDGSFFEDVQLLGDDVVSEEVDVNLVEIYTVVTDREGRPVGGLSADDFEVSLGRERIEVERFARAEEVSLSLGVVIDSSESMYSLMDDTKRAASRFLSDTLTPIDRAFVVEFDDRPRLVHATSNDVMALIRSLSSLQASGMTALYDSILFAHLQFEPGLGRKAIVLLTDGDDFNSKFSYRKAYQTAASAGLPIYFLSLAGFDEDRRSFRKSDLEALSKASGGRVFYVSSMEEVVDAYAQIADELRNQYVLAFTSAAPLSDDEIDKIKVQTTRGRGLDLRWVVGRE